LISALIVITLVVKSICW